jgi:tetratricopeptide (TPR) repeat protein
VDPAPVPASAVPPPVVGSPARGAALLASGLGGLKRASRVPGWLLRHPWHGLALVVSLVLIVGVAGALIVHLYASYHLRAARSAVAKYHSEKAKQHLDKCFKVRPKDREALLLATRTARRLGAYDEADEFLKGYEAEVDKDDDDLLLEKILLLIERGEPDRFVQLCQNMTEQDHPSAPLVLEAMVRAYVRMFRPTDAGLCLGHWLERDPENTEALFFRGLVNEQTGRRVEAVATYRQVLSLDPEFDQARARMCDLLLDERNGEEALPHLEYLHREQPDNFLVQVQLAKCLDLLHRQDEAVDLLDNLLARQPHHPEALAQRGIIAQRAGDDERAEAWLREAVRYMPGDKEAQHQFYQCLIHRGKKDEAKKVEDQLNQIDQDLQGLEELITKKMPRAPHDAALHYEAGMIALRAGMVREAVRWFQSTVNEDPGHVAAHEALAHYYRHVGQHLLAKEHETKARQAKEAGSAHN